MRDLFYRHESDGGRAMTARVDCSCELYAVIEARWSEGPERFVIAYRDEESLRDVIAAPSILGFGFITREEALATAKCDSPNIRGSRQGLRAPVDRAERHRRWFPSAKRRLVDWLRVPDIRRIACRALQHGGAMAILVFYSKNIVSAAIRTVIGAS